MLPETGRPVYNPEITVSFPSLAFHVHQIVRVFLFGKADNFVVVCVCVCVCLGIRSFVAVHSVCAACVVVSLCVCVLVLCICVYVFVHVLTLCVCARVCGVGHLHYKSFTKTDAVASPMLFSGRERMTLS